MSTYSTEKMSQEEYVDQLFSDASDVVHFTRNGQRTNQRIATKCHFDKYLCGCVITRWTKDDEVRYLAHNLCDSLPFETAPTCREDEKQRRVVRAKIRFLRDEFMNRSQGER